MTPVRVDVVSIFPDYLAPLDLSLIGKARRDGILDVRVHDLRDFAHDRHRTVDDSPFGGGAGMVMKPEPWAEALDAVVASGPGGRGRRAAPARARPGRGAVHARRWHARWREEPWLAFACGRYEGLDERVYEHAADRMPVTVVSLGDYVLNGGEVAVLAMVEAVGRLLPGVVGNAESLVEESHEDGLLEYPVYTRPASWDDAGTVREVPAGAALRRPRRDRRAGGTSSASSAPPPGDPTCCRSSATTGALADLDVRVAVPADAAELLVLQRACWVREGLAARGRWVVPPLAEELDDVAARAGGVDDVRRARASADGAPGRLVASVRARRHPDDATRWEVGRLMVAPDLQGRGLGRELLALAESLAPADGHRLRAHHRGARGGQPAPLQAGGLPAGDGRAHPAGHRRPRQAPPLTPTFPPDPGTFTFAPERKWCEPEGSGAELGDGRPGQGCSEALRSSGSSRA